ncbi:right-handed parallel beta-helix repeat-containing protein [Candidatus Binatus sp.]|uniref:right-handed parallel beta-helix repeat-containing protein n=1 Tax=Candidatus Binatus sp. TaxID=2811406 RepID=UPI003CBAF241
MKQLRPRDLIQSVQSFGALMVLSIALGGALCGRAEAATLCVNHGGSGSCFSSIGAAVAAASSNDTIRVADGTYKEDVIIDKSLTLLGASQKHTIIDASRLSNGIYVDGIDNPGLSNVVVSNFKVENANFEGILVANASAVTIKNCMIMFNDRNQTTAPSCPGIPSFETGESFDCGEGLHLTGVDHSTVSNNTIEENTGGILLSDDTGTTHDNMISSNMVMDNPFDCGITLASHPAAALTGSGSPLGVFNNTIAANSSLDNGLVVPGAGAGVGIFDSVPGAKNFGNTVIHNRLEGNGLPGVALHSHTPGQNLNDNMIIGNRINGNGMDTSDAATTGPTGINIFGVSAITGTVISQNVITHESLDIVVSTPGDVTADNNDLHGAGRTGVQNVGSGNVDATDNWWGCKDGPGVYPCSNVNGPGSVSFSPWLNKPVK